MHTLLIKELLLLQIQMICDKKFAFKNSDKNNAPLTSCILKINNTLIDNAEYLDIVIHMYNLINYSKNYSKTTRTLWNYYRDEPNCGAVGKINYSMKNSRTFDYKTGITGRLEGNNTEKEDIEILVQLKYLGNFWRTLDIPLTAK